ncbi:hypothetical protein [Plasmodium yoelii yoelii]|uniref:Uncharacterized protein n=1 Tax=Plasmodium yoelii yoelii TaxID=73239 RepID=Q7RFP7_PLAYO|nr:hypothetical protein [Plasmodium yoelii yoelii]
MRYRGGAKNLANSTTSVLTATILIYAIGAGITAAAGTRLALQLIFGKVLNSHHSNYKTKIWPYIVISCHYLSYLELAISQAPSPESNSNSPLPVIAMLGQYPNIKS